MFFSLFFSTSSAPWPDRQCLETETDCPSGCSPEPDLYCCPGHRPDNMPMDGAVRPFKGVQNDFGLMDLYRCYTTDAHNRLNNQKIMSMKFYCEIILPMSTEQYFVINLDQLNKSIKDYIQFINNIFPFCVLIEYSVFDLSSLFISMIVLKMM